MSIVTRAGISLIFFDLFLFVVDYVHKLFDSFFAAFLLFGSYRLTRRHSIFGNRICIQQRAVIVVRSDDLGGIIAVIEFHWREMRDILGSAFFLAFFGIVLI